MDDQHSQGVNWADERFALIATALEQIKIDSIPPRNAGDRALLSYALRGWRYGKAEAIRWMYANLN